jgi:STE24 endopeptidase
LPWPGSAHPARAGRYGLPSQPASTQAYSLPPDKLAKAIALSHIRTALDIAGSLWGLAVLWLLLAFGWAAGLAAWAERLLRRRWLQGLLFFAVFLVVTNLASLPLDVIGHMVSRHYGISVQGWGSWLGDLAKALGLSLLFGVPVLLFFNWIVKHLAAPLLVLDLAGRAATHCDFHLCISAARSHLQQIRTPRQESRRAGG